MSPFTLATIKFKKVVTKKRIINSVLFLLFLLAGLGGYFLGRNLSEMNLASLLTAISQKEKSITQTTEPTTSPEAEEIKILLPKVYEETAEAGEGITHLARKALRDYLKENGNSWNLTPEHKIYIEDYLQNKIGNFSLQLGQKLTFSEELIKEAIDSALQLTPQELANLTQYSQLVPELNY